MRLKESGRDSCSGLRGEDRTAVGAVGALVAALEGTVDFQGCYTDGVIRCRPAAMGSSRIISSNGTKEVEKLGVAAAGALS